MQSRALTRACPVISKTKLVLEDEGKNENVVNGVSVRECISSSALEACVA